MGVALARHISTGCRATAYHNASHERFVEETKQFETVTKGGGFCIFGVSTTYAHKSKSVHLGPRLRGILGYAILNICSFLHDKKEGCIAYEATNAGLGLSPQAAGDSKAHHRRLELPGPVRHQNAVLARVA